MLTTVYLDGPMGREFGKKWELSVASPAEALRLINANKPGLMSWIRNNLATYEKYRVICKYEDGRTEELNNESYSLERKLKSIRFIPIIEGAGGDPFVQTVLGVVLVVLDVAFFHTGYLTDLGVAMIIGGVVQALIGGQPPLDQNKDNKNSYYFNGPANTTRQGAPVSLIYGRVLVGSQLISSNISIDQLIATT